MVVLLLIKCILFNVYFIEGTYYVIVIPLVFFLPSLEFLWMVFAAAIVVFLGIVISIPQKDRQYKLLLERPGGKETGEKHFFLFFLPWFVEYRIINFYCVRVQIIKCFSVIY